MSVSTAAAKDSDIASNAAADPELDAIQTVLRALSALDDNSRHRVIEYVFDRLGLSEHSKPPADGPDASAGASRLNSLQSPTSAPTATMTRDIRSLKEAKKPRSAIEMAVLVAYYLAEVAAQADKKTEIGTDEINKYFKQADFPLPGSPRKALANAKAAGYMDSAARGLYKLNPVGHNLIVHSLPATGPDRPTKKAAKKKAKSGGRKTRRK